MRAPIKLYVSIGIVLLILMMGGGHGFSASKGIDDLCGEYISAWKMFYPSRAFSRGFQGSIFQFENFSLKKISSWIEMNKQTLSSIGNMIPELSVDERINARLLRTQIVSELDKWEKETPHKNSPGFYSGYIAQAVPRVLDSNILMPGEKIKLILQRLDKVRNLCMAGNQMLKNGSPEETRRSVRTLERSAAFFAGSLPLRIKGWLEKKALAEIREVRKIIAEAAGEYLREAYPNREIPAIFTNRQN